MTDKTPLACWIYRSGKKNEMYLYVNKEDDFTSVPDSLRQLFGTPTLVMQLELHPKRRLAREDVGQVMENLRQHGFHLQMPPNIVPEMMHS